MHPIFVSYHTPDALYTEHAAGLRDSLLAFGLDHDIRPIDAQTWAQATSYKARFVRDMLDAYPGRPVVWLDADARVRQYPGLFDWLVCDFAAHWRNGTELLSGTMYWGPTDRGKALADEWVRECEANPQTWDQKCLAAALQRKPETRVVDLPAPYTLIFDSMADLGPPVIEHLQASREVRRRERDARLVRHPKCQS